MKLSRIFSCCKSKNNDNSSTGTENQEVPHKIRITWISFVAVISGK